jgi:hypothetical protein
MVMVRTDSGAVKAERIVHMMSSEVALVRLFMRRYLAYIVVGMILVFAAIYLSFQLEISPFGKDYIIYSLESPESGDEIRCFLIPALLVGLLLWIRARINNQNNSLFKPTMVTTMLFFALVGLFFGSLVGVASDFEYSETVRLNSHNYVISSRYALLAIGGAGSQMFTLYECDSLRVLCKILHYVSLPQGTHDMEDRKTATIATDVTRNTVSMLLDGEVVYTYSFDSPDN